MTRPTTPPIIIATSSVPRSNLTAVTELLCTLFDVNELQYLIATGVDGDDLSRTVPHGLSRSDLARWYVEALSRRSTLDAAWFDRLAALRPNRIADIDAVRTSHPCDEQGRPDLRPWHALTPTPSFLDPAARRSSGGLQLAAILRETSTTGAPLPILRCTFKNGSPGSLTVTAVELDATREQAFDTFVRPYVLDPAAYWDLEIPEAGGTSHFQVRSPLVIPSGRPAQVALRLYVLRGSREKVAPKHCGAYTLSLKFITAEGASATSEPVPV